MRSEIRLAFSRFTLHASRFTLHASRFTLILLAAFLFVSCEGNNDDLAEVDTRPSAPQGLAQARVAEDGISEVVIAMAPSGQGVPAPSLESLRGKDLFEIAAKARGDVRARSVPDRPAQNSGMLCVYEPIWVLRLLDISGASDEYRQGYVNSLGVIDTVWASDGYLVFEKRFELAGTQEVAFSRGDLAARAKIWRDESRLRIQINDWDPLTIGSFSTGESHLRCSIILPLNFGHFAGLDSDLLPDYAGVWEVTSNPPFPPQPTGIEGVDPAIYGTTPFSFRLKAMTTDVVSADYEEDTVNESGALECEGATYQVNATIYGGASEEGAWDEGTVAYRADVVNPSNQVIRTFYGYGGSSNPLGTAVVQVPWDGKTNAGVKAPGGIDYAVKVTAVVERFPRPLPIESSGRMISTGKLGPPEADLPPFTTLHINPGSYIPYVRDEWLEMVDETGQWRDTDEDGLPDQFPDHDSDGQPDFQPWEEPPGIFFFANIQQTGMKTSWELAGFEEDGTPIPGAFWPGEDEDVDFEWKSSDIPANLDPQKLSFKLTVNQCRDNDVPLEIRTQGSVPICYPSDFAGSVVYGNVPVLRVFGGNREKDFSFSSDSTPTAIELSDVFTERKLLVFLSNAGIVPANQQSVNVTLKLNKSSPQSSSFYLPRTGPESFALEVDIPDLLTDFSAPESETLDSQAFTSLDMADHPSKQQGSGEFVDNLLGKGQTELGRARMTGFPSTLLGNQVFSTKSAVRAAGYEAVSVETSDPSIRKPIEVRFRVKNQVPLLYYAGPGEHSLGKIVCLGGGFNPATDLTFFDWSKVRTAVFIGNSVFDINDYNKNFGVGGAKCPDFSPGFDWDAKLGFDKGNLLGYNSKAPNGESDGAAVIRRFFGYLDIRFFKNNKAGLEEVALAWITANAENGQDNACAITPRGYYYISRKFKRNFEVNLKNNYRYLDRRLYFLPRDVWDGLQASQSRDDHLLDRRRRHIKDFPDFEN